MSVDKHEFENRRFLHDMATPISVLALLVKRISAIVEGKVPEEEQKRLPEFLAKAKQTLESLQHVHAEFKLAIYTRNSENSASDSKKTG